MGNPLSSKGYWIEQDLNLLVNNGIYTCYYTKGDRVTEAHYPNSEVYWLVAVLKAESWILQIAFSIQAQLLCYRIKNGNVDWYSWQQVTTTTL